MAQLSLPSQALNKPFRVPPEPHAERDALPPPPAAFACYAVTVGNLGLLLPRGTTGEVIDDLSTCRLPRTPPWLRGMANLRGNVVPVFDLEELLDLDGRGTSRTRFLVLGQGKRLGGLLIRRLPFRVTLRHADRMSGQPLLPAPVAAFVRTCYDDGRVWLDWDADAFFAALGARLSCGRARLGPGPETA